MAPTAVIEQFEVFENGGARLGAGPPLNLVDEFDLQACKEAFGDRVVPAIAAGLMLPRIPCCANSCW